MHPIERLRYVARAGWAGPAVLAAEAAWALAELAEREAPALVPACRRLLDRQPGCGPLWWVAARVLGARDPVVEAEHCAQDLDDDPTSAVLYDALPSGARAVHQGGIGEVASADLVVVEVEALGAGGMVGDSKCASLLEAARAIDVPVWVEAGVGKALPPRLFEAMCRRLDGTRPASRFAAHRSEQARYLSAARGSGDAKRFDFGGVQRVVGPNGAQSLADVLSCVECPEPPELLEGF